MKGLDVFLQKYSLLLRVVLKLDTIESFIALFDDPNDLVDILKITKLTESFYKDLLFHLKSKPLFYSKVLMLYSYLKMRKELTKNLFLNLIENEWIRNNVIFLKGPGLSYQLYNNIDERLYSDIDMIISSGDIKNLLGIIKRYGNYRDRKIWKFYHEIPITPNVGLIDVVFKEYIPFNITPNYVSIYGKKIMVLNAIDTLKISVFINFFATTNFDIYAIKNMFLSAAIEAGITENFLFKAVELQGEERNCHAHRVRNDLSRSLRGSDFLEYDYQNIMNHIYTQTINKNYSDEVLQDFFIITFNGKNIAKKILYLFKFMNKYNIKYNLSCFYRGKLYLVKKILNMSCINLAKWWE